MKSNLTKQAIVVVVLVVLIYVVHDPSILWMSSTIRGSVLVALTAIFGLLASFIISEKAVDERDIIHRSMAARAAAASGTIVLLAAIVITGFSGQKVNHWIILTLMVMIVVKVSTRIYLDKYK